jgi:hypothetical protein
MIKSAQMQSVAPGMPTADIQRTIEFYRLLGFAMTLNRSDFVILERECIELHFALKTDHDPKHTATWIYVRVADPDALHEEFASAGVQRLGDVHGTDYKMREFPVIDPDGNLLLFGAPVGRKDSADPP